MERRLGERRQKEKRGYFVNYLMGALGRNQNQISLSLLDDVHVEGSLCKFLQGHEEVVMSGSESLNQTKMGMEYYRIDEDGKDEGL